ncbi:proteasome regulatory particle base subunit [Starmerella bacillaris]|uniref:26S proteasome regulatory subunit RPN2 n=1 Tax=Starmerella bacillaris TaxID=1247836 RepID=A0AAV5RNH5_STABA|nr:proteasome regulatory particle base subunit [Starmerella bacillaris]
MVLALLDEPDYALKEYALKTLHAEVNERWPEISDYLPAIEELFEDATFPARSLAALVVAKVYFNLDDHALALKYALAAGNELDLSQRSEFVDTIISHSIKTYVDARQKLVDGEGAATSEPSELIESSDLSETIDTETDPALAQIVQQMLQRCTESGEVQLALGIALDARRLDLVEKFLADGDASDVAFVLDTAMTLVENRRFRSEVLHLLVRLIQPGSPGSPAYFLLGKLSIQLNDSRLAHTYLSSLEPAQAIQVAFDYVASASQELREKTALLFRDSSKSLHAKIVRILSGVPTCDFSVTFLSTHAHVDVNILQRMKTHLDSRNSMFHAALSFQNALLHLGTTHDSFFRSNVEWLGRATHWTRFTATAALGVIHQGNLTQGMRILHPYLNKSDKASAHVRGGALYGLGLVFAGFGTEVLPFLQEQVLLSTRDEYELEDEVAVHGACLGLALAGMRSQDEQLYARLRSELYVDSAVVGEAVGIAMGLVMLGSKHAVAETEMLQYARDTQHEKIVRSLGVGLALLNFGREEAADELVSTLLSEHEPILRYGGCFTLALAYAGTGNTRATQKLLHAAVSDSSDDVRRAAVMALGFVYIRNYLALPRMLELLAESHNPHVRYGTALALGVACAGTGLIAAIDVLEPMLRDPVDFVRQGAMVGLALVLVQHTETSHPRVKAVREYFAKIIKTKNEDALAKFGAALAQGLIDAGGCNATISLEHRQTGNLDTRAVAGLAVFLQYWYWFPLAHFVSLAYTPTTVVCVTPDLKVPKLQLECAGAPAKRFNYPAKLEEPGQKVPEQLVSAVLSTTLKEKRKSSVKDRERERVERERKAKEAEETERERKRHVEAMNRDVFEVDNMSRVIPWQRKYLKFSENSAFKPVFEAREPSGVLVVEQIGDAEVEYITTQRQSQSGDDDQDEAPLPRPFTLTVHGDGLQ